MPVLVFDGEAEELIFLPVDPPQYIDPVNAFIGPVDCSLPPNALRRWQNGPEIAANSLELLEREFLPLSAAGMPTPKARETETLPPTLPVPHLHITESQIGPSHDRYRRILDLQAHKARIVKSLLNEETTSRRMDSETLSALLAPLG